MCERQRDGLPISIKHDEKMNGCGVPQGSVLGPIHVPLFITYLHNSSSKISFYLSFPDDTNIHSESDSLRKL